MNNVLIIGNGGREHAMAWKMAQSADVKTVYVAPGNGGTAKESNVENIEISPDDHESLIAFAQKNDISLTIVGPEQPLADGIVDAFSDEGLNIYGPSKKAAQLESLKSFSKDFFVRHGIPSAKYGVFRSISEAEKYIDKIDVPVVIKADGLCSGKGVFICHSKDEAVQVAQNILVDKQFSDAGNQIVIEEFLVGEEASIIVMVDKQGYVTPFASSQDHKARDDGDKGPNTGGMGAYSPAPVISQIIEKKILQEIIEPTVQGMRDEGLNYCGFLYAGVMIDTEGRAKILEYNCRLGDPEAQPLLMRLQSDFFQICMTASTGTLENISLKWDSRCALGVVMASGGYPEAYQKEKVIHGLDLNYKKHTKVFHGGTTLNTNGSTITSGGRVLCVTSLGKNVSNAKLNAYGVVKHISWEEHFYRLDIGYRAVLRENEKFSNSKVLTASLSNHKTKANTHRRKS